MVVMGAPGAGKGTQAKLLAEKYKTPQISTGDLLRDAVAAGSPLGRLAKAAMDSGQLVSDEVVLGVIRERLARSDTRKGFILDGFPRNMPQVQALEQLLEELGRPIELVTLIEVDFDILMQRMTGRRTCRSCGWACNIYSAPPRVDGLCDECGGNLRHRTDDNEETIGNRLRIYETQTIPVVDFYREQAKLRVIQGIGEIKTVFKAMAKVVDSALASRPAGSRAGSGKAARAIAAQRAAAAAKKKTARPESSRSGAKSSTTSKPAKKKPAVKKAAVKKKVAAKKPAAKKPANKTPAKKKVVKKKTVKKAAKKTSAVKKKTATRKTAAKKSASRNKVAKKKVTKKTVARKKTATAKKTVSKKKVSAKKKAVNKKKKAPARKKVAKKRR